GHLARRPTRARRHHPARHRLPPRPGPPHPPRRARRHWIAPTLPRPVLHPPRPRLRRPRMATQLRLRHPARRRPRRRPRHHAPLAAHLRKQPLLCPRSGSGVTVFRRGVRALITGPDGRILLMRVRDEMPLDASDPVTDYWILVGGGVEPGESLDAAMVREIFEETGQVVDD